MSIPAQGAVGAETMTADKAAQWPNNSPNPTPQELASPQFQAIWQAIKSWDIGIPEEYGGYCGATGSHVVRILRALASPRADSDERTAGWGLEPIAEIKKLFGRAVEEDGRLFDTEDAIDDLCDAVIDRLRSIPAQPAGAVPDSLRALSEDYARKLEARRAATGAYNAAYDAILKTGRSPKFDELLAERSVSSRTEMELTDATIVLLDACRDFASHPAGQSAGSGADADLAALAEAASVPERAYGILWRLTAFDTVQIGYAHDARKVLLAAMDKEGQRRGIAWATRQYGPLGPNPRFMLSDEDRMEMGL